MYDTGTTAFMIIATALVIMMTPALALFYGGLSRRKHSLNTIAMCLLAMGVVGVTWALIGDSIAYGNATDAFDENGNLVNVAALFVGGLERLGSNWTITELIDANASTATTVGGAEIGAYPGSVRVAFQASFAIVTTAIVSGSLAGRLKFGPWAFITVLWPLLVYAPMAHMVWGGGIIGNANAIGSLDFAGGTAVHITSGLSGLVLCLILGKRRGFDQMSYRPHNVPSVVLGMGLLFVGWFGFNGGSALAANGNAGIAIFNTVIAACAACASWAVVERIKTGKPTVVGMSTGVIAGLVVITPACGFVAPWAAVVMGIIVSPICYFAIAFLKHKLGYDDALDAFGCHGVGGLVGCILTGLFTLPDLATNGAAGLLYTGDPTLLIAQCLAVLVTIAYVAVVTGVLGFVTKKLFANTLRVPKEEEDRGLDITQHGESAYPAFLGLD